MLIDWFTVGAQALNFIILAGLLKRFLYKPILDGIAAREKRIADDLANAAASKSEAQAERELFKQKNDALEAQRASLLGKAVEEAGVERRRLLEDARKAQDLLSAQWRTSMRRDEMALAQSIRLRTRQQVFAIVRKALKDLSSTSLEERMVDTFIRRFRGMDAATKGLLVAGAQAEGGYLVRSAFGLSDDQKTMLHDAIIETLPSKASTRFITAPDLVAGIELEANGRKIAWSIDDYVTSLDTRITDNATASPQTHAALQ
jgi:F-type H+-transporting ATPase subunit b